MFELLEIAINEEEPIYTAFHTMSGGLGPNPQVFIIKWNRKELISRSFALERHKSGSLMMLDEHYDPKTDEFVRHPINMKEATKHKYLMLNYGL